MFSEGEGIISAVRLWLLAANWLVYWPVAYVMGAISHAIFTGWLAATKNRPVQGWVVLGFIFGPIALWARDSGW